MQDQQSGRSCLCPGDQRADLLFDSLLAAINKEFAVGYARSVTLAPAAVRGHPPRPFAAHGIVPIAADVPSVAIEIWAAGGAAARWANRGRARECEMENAQLLAIRL